ncbi:helix-turn-helix domain-containing protein [Streptomyces sp. Li-HN-5-11]|uniref:PucR family transcriptional regulator n=1 Tax=Streptomyces sp. Li-HN-5-11 TaxID=3075432 RepID=UPI0028ADCF59|nr:helix-turn-helix domain-containing protein [Streptomyces sp. Li-HN-5-11]WNM32455.1 helix-turn-helix domain-containing protein [Streptomyces sp. Li-HN-5-11]WOP38790.1 helix-turn-helix domain-containing protein [Streptomyces sp. Li-HN-5-13]
MAVPTPQGLPDGGHGVVAPLPPGLAERLRAQLEPVADEVEEEVRRQVPEYARPADGTYRRNLRAGVVQALTLFVDHIGDPRGQGDAIAGTYYELGRGEALEGRSLDALQSALRIGGLHAWRLLCRTAEDLGLDSAVVAALGELAFRTVHEVAEAAAAGYAEAQLRSTDELERRRRRLLDLLVSEGPVSPETVQDLAHGARWPLPRQVAVIALAATPDQREEERPPAAAGVLVDMESRPPRVLVPDPDGSGRFGGRALALALRGRPAAVGPTVALTEAAQSLHWATRALGLMGRGVLPRQGMVRCADHLSTLLLHSDEPLLAQLQARVLAPLDAVSAGQRARLAETLLAWLLSGSNVPDVATRLHIHPQTVRYRLRQLEKLFGDALHDPGTRLDLVLALRAEALRDPDALTR